MLRPPSSLLLGLCGLLLLLPSPSRSQPVATLIRELRAATFPAQKNPLGRRIGALKSAEAREALEALLAERDAWNRKAAIAGLFSLEDLKVLPRLLRMMQTELFYASEIEEGLRANPALFVPPLIQAFRAEGDARQRERLFAVLESCEHADLPPFLASLAEGKDEGLCARAVESYGRQLGKAALPQLRRWLERPSLRLAARTALARQGWGWNPALRGVWIELMAARRVSDRRDEALRLAAVPGAETREAVSLLLEGVEPCHREAGIVALGVMGGEGDLDRLLAMRGSHGFQTQAVDRALSEGMSRFFPAVRRCWVGSRSEGTRKLLESCMIRSAHGPAMDFLVGEAASTGADAVRIFGRLVEAAPDRILDLARRRVKEKAFRERALACLDRRGTARDLPVLLAAAEGPEGADGERILAFEGVARLGDEPTKIRVFQGAFRRSPACLRAALELFAEVEATVLQDELAAAARGHAVQDLRMKSALLLARWKDRQAVPLLVKALGERYVARRERLAPALFSALTLGLSAVGDYVGRRYDRKAFEALRKKIFLALKEISGRDLGEDEDGWRQWALDHGHVLEDGNLVQELFASDPARRRRAADGAARVLGHDDLAALHASDPMAAKRQGLALSLLLAERLVKAGYLRD